MDLHCQDCLKFLEDDQVLEQNRRKTTWVLLLVVATTVGEIIAGRVTGSMALVAEGWHMASHAGALLIALVAYQVASSQKLSRNFTFGAGKVIPLGGFTSAIVLSVIAVLIFSESVERLFSPTPIQYNEAIGIAVFGLAVNLASALILRHEHGHAHGDEHCEHDHAHVRDHNLRAALLHILADAATAVLAIAGLLVAKLQNWTWIDPAVGIVEASVIAVWASRLCLDTGWELLDGHSKAVDWDKLRSKIENEGTRIIDFHIWRIAPKAIACELVVEAASPRGREHYHRILKDEFSIQHVVVEERTGS